MQRTLPALIALVASLAVAAGAAMAEPSPQPRPARPAASHPPPRAPPRSAPATQPSGRPPPPPNSLGADWRLQQDEARQLRRQQRIMPLGRVIEQINARSPGRQLDAGLEYQGDRPIYRVRWMTRNGRRVDYLIDAATGAILSGG
ncbi:MAG TPA: PepSY domain-containing protein [Caulobacteraceae bacterium]|jgi:hypothetical protein